MWRSHYNPQRSDSIWPKAPVTATQVVILLVIALAAMLCIDWTLGASRSRVAARSDAPVSAPADCPQLADTFDARRAACLRRRWSAMREMKPWPDAPQNALLEECLRSAGGDVAVPFKTNSCGYPKTSPQPDRAQN